MADFPPPLFEVPLGGNPLEFRDDACPSKNRGMGLPYGESFIILLLLLIIIIVKFVKRHTRSYRGVFVWYTHVTHGQTGDSILRAEHIMLYAVARWKINVPKDQIKVKKVFNTESYVLKHTVPSTVDCSLSDLSAVRPSIHPSGLPSCQLTMCGRSCGRWVVC